MLNSVKHYVLWLQGMSENFSSTGFSLIFYRDPKVNLSHEVIILAIQK